MVSDKKTTEQVIVECTDCGAKRLPDDITNKEILEKIVDLETQNGQYKKSLDARNLRLPTLAIIGLIGFFVWATFVIVTERNKTIADHNKQEERIEHLEESHRKNSAGFHPHDHPEIEAIDDKHKDDIRDLQYKWERFSDKHDDEKHHEEFVTEAEFKLWCVRMQLKNPEWKCDPAIKKGMNYEDMRELERFWHKNKIRRGDLGG